MLSNDIDTLPNDNPDELDNTAIARRMRILRYCVTGGGHGSQTRFATQLGIEMGRWNNFERGYPLPRDTAVQLVCIIPGLTTDWIWLARENGLPAQLQHKLADAGKALDLADAEKVLKLADAKKVLMTAAVPGEEKMTVLYRHYDENGALLYVGISLNAVRRLGQHSEKPWFSSIKRVEVQPFENRAAALRAEAEAIANEYPKFNIQHRLLKKA